MGPFSDKEYFDWLLQGHWKGYAKRQFELMHFYLLLGPSFCFALSWNSLSTDGYNLYYKAKFLMEIIENIKMD